MLANDGDNLEKVVQLNLSSFSADDLVFVEDGYIFRKIKRKDIAELEELKLDKEYTETDGRFYYKGADDKTFCFYEKLNLEDREEKTFILFPNDTGEKIVFIKNVLT